MRQELARTRPRAEKATVNGMAVLFAFLSGHGVITVEHRFFSLSLFFVDTAIGGDGMVSNGDITHDDTCCSRSWRT